MKAFQVQDSLNEFQKSLETFQMQDSLNEFQKSMETFQMQDSLKEFRKSMEAFQMQDSLKEFRKSMEVFQMQDPLKEFRKSMGAFHIQDPLEEFQESLKAFQTLGVLDDLVNSISDGRWNLVLNGISEIEVDADGQVVVDSTLVTQEKVQELAQQVIRNSIEAGAHQFEEYIDTLINEIRSLKDPVLQRILAWLIYPLIVGLVLSVVSPIADYYVKEKITGGERRQVVKDVSRAITGAINDRVYLNSFRVVTATSLNVRKLGANHSDVVGKLYLGDVVEVIEKDRKWSLIIWQDSENDASVRGWVFSRYLKVIK